MESPALVKTEILTGRLLDNYLGHPKGTLVKVKVVSHGDKILDHAIVGLAE